MATSSLYTRIGGAVAVEAAVDVLYKKLLANEMLKPFFEGIDMKRLARHMAAFLTFAFGGSKKWTGRSIYMAHRRLISEKGLNTTHFDAVGAELAQTLQELSVPQDLIDEVLAIVVPLRPIFDPAYQPTEADRKPAAAAADSAPVVTGSQDAASATTGSAAVVNEDPAATATLFERLGGQPALDAVVDTLYNALVADDRLARFFEGVDMQKLRRHQARFLAFAFGHGKWSGKTVYGAHKKLIQEKGLTTEHFDIVAGHIVDSLKTHTVPPALIDEAVAIVVPLRPVFDPAYQPSEADKKAPAAAADSAPVAKGSEAAAAQDAASATTGSAAVMNEEPAAKATLFERLGGQPALDAVVDTLYNALVADDRLARFFEGVDMQKLRRHQARFLAFAFGHGKWSGKTVYGAHKTLIQEKGLTTEHFDIVAGHIVDSVKTHAVPQSLIDEAVAIVVPLRPIFDPAYQPTEADKKAH